MSHIMAGGRGMVAQVSIKWIEGHVKGWLVGKCMCTLLVMRNNTSFLSGLVIRGKWFGS